MSIQETTSCLSPKDSRLSTFSNTKKYYHPAGILFLDPKIENPKHKVAYQARLALQALLDPLSKSIIRYPNPKIDHPNFIAPKLYTQELHSNYNFLNTIAAKLSNTIPKRQYHETHYTIEISPPLHIHSKKFCLSETKKSILSSFLFFVIVAIVSLSLNRVKSKESTQQASPPPPPNFS